MAKPLRAAACHVSPAFLSASQTTRKCIDLIHQAASNKANLVILPESYIPAFPIWSSLRAPTENHDRFKCMAKESIYIDGEEMNAIRSAAKQTNTIVSLGISEKARYSSATLWNSNILIGNQGEILNHHRKLMPTFFEKLTWSQGDGYGLKVVDTAFGKIGTLICGENTNPLARYALMAQGEQVHISTWPAVWPTRALNSSSEGAKDGSGIVGNYDNVAANRTRAAAHCFEAKCFGILCSGFLDKKAIDIVAEGSDDAANIRQTLQASPRGATMFLTPTGAAMKGYTIDKVTGEKREEEFLQNEEGILYTDLNVEDCMEGKQYHDVVGGYQRFDIFDLKVNRTRREPARFIDNSTDTEWSEAED